MIKVLLLCVFTIASIKVFAQTEAQLKQLDSARKALVFSAMFYPYIDSSPGYLGGEEKWNRYVSAADLMQETIRKARENKVPDGHYTIIIRFAVNADSTLSDIKPIIGK